MLQGALDRQAVAIELTNERGEALQRQLQLNQLAPQALEGDLLSALGFERLRIPLRPVVGDGKTLRVERDDRVAEPFDLCDQLVATGRGPAWPTEPRSRA